MSSFGHGKYKLLSSQDQKNSATEIKVGVPNETPSMKFTSVQMASIGLYIQLSNLEIEVRSKSEVEYRIDNQVKEVCMPAASSLHMGRQPVEIQ